MYVCTHGDKGAWGVQGTRERSSDGEPQREMGAWPGFSAPPACLAKAAVKDPPAGRLCWRVPWGTRPPVIWRHQARGVGREAWGVERGAWGVWCLMPKASKAGCHATPGALCSLCKLTSAFPSTCLPPAVQECRSIGGQEVGWWGCNHLDGASAPPPGVFVRGTENPICDLCFLYACT